jgi:hypothetical protein
MASSVVMNRASRRGPPKVKFTAPASLISPSATPPGAKTWTPDDEEL